MQENEFRQIFDKCWKESKLESIGLITGSNGLYYLGNGCYTGKSGWEMFEKELKNQINNGKERKS
jgi:hypothetical protein